MHEPVKAVQINQCFFFGGGKYGGSLVTNLAKKRDPSRSLALEKYSRLTSGGLIPRSKACVQSMVADACHS
jgi:hypothetical protein